MSDQTANPGAIVQLALLDRDKTTPPVKDTADDSDNPDNPATCAWTGQQNVIALSRDSMGEPDARSARLQTRTGVEGRLKPTDLLSCHVVWRLTAGLFRVACDHELPQGSAQRRPQCHIRQIAMYLCHVVLSMPHQTIAFAFLRDRSTVAHACSVVEDRRDDPGYDRFIERCERCVSSVLGPLGRSRDSL